MNLYTLIPALALVLATVDAPAQTTGTLGVFCDTIQPTAGFCLDTTVTSFVVTFFIGTVAFDKGVHGHCYHHYTVMPSGSMVLISSIVSSPEPGVHVRLPARKYYVR